MISRVARALALIAMTAGLAASPLATASGEDDPDTTAPQVDLNPCSDQETGCRRVYAEVFGDLQAGDDLAVLGARIGERVLAEHVFDDGTGFERYGSFLPYGNDVMVYVDYALSVAVPRGTNDITLYARDLEGNTSELTTTVSGPVPPGPVRHLKAELARARQAEVSWSPAALHGSCCAEYVVTTAGRHPRSSFTAPPRFSPPSVRYRKLSPGWHRFTVHAATAGGKGPSRTVRLFVPRQHRG